MRRKFYFASAFVAIGGLLQLFACGGNSGIPARSGAEYQEYECPAPIGKIVREDCSRSALQYQGDSFSGSVGAGGLGASASYRQTAIREADSLVQMLKEQRVALCNNFNTCKLSVSQYREEQQHLDDSFVALLALKDKMAMLDAEGATKMLAEINSIRTGAKNKVATDAAPSTAATSAPATSTVAAPVATPTPATTQAPVATAAATAAGFKCKGPALLMFKRGTIAGPTFNYDKTRETLKGHSELNQVEFYEFLVESDTLTGKKQEYYLVGVSPDIATREALRKVVKAVNPTAGQDTECPAKTPERKLSIDL